MKAFTRAVDGTSSELIKEKYFSMLLVSVT